MATFRGGIVGANGGIDPPARGIATLRPGMRPAASGMHTFSRGMALLERIGTVKR
ncbi:MAG: hypothetical protein KDK97_04030 [Verrucomicrobiales bacterium]|nr:hypothetical protein [Verrucomicrobiales bacterium]MCP5557182.1 hypothetical protein [Verrucomicrobiaceae bacterium]